MSTNSISSFFAQRRQKQFAQRVNTEIYDRLFPHLLGEKNYGYSFKNDDEMDAQTAALDAHALLETIEQHARNMGEGYGKAFRHVMHRELNEQLRMFADLARRHDHSKRKIDTKFVAVHA